LASFRLPIKFGQLSKGRLKREPIPITGTQFEKPDTPFNLLSGAFNVYLMTSLGVQKPLPHIANRRLGEFSERDALADKQTNELCKLSTSTSKVN
jgi:hypothetical protein